MSKKNFKVLVLTSTFPRWEGDTDPPFVYDLCRLLSENFEIDVLAPAYPGSNDKDRYGELKVIRFRYFLKPMEKLTYSGGILPNIKKNPLLLLTIPFFLVFQSLAVLKQIRTNDYDLIHAHWLIPQGIVAVLVKKLSKIDTKIIVTSHGADLFSLRDRLSTLLKKTTLKSVDHITVVSRTMKKRCIEMDTSPEKITVIPMGVDLSSRFTPPKSDSERKNLVFIGRLASKKGVEVLIRSMKHVLRRFPDCILTVIGDGHDRNNLENLSKNLGVEENIVFMGKLENGCIPRYLKKHHTAIVPSVISQSGDQEGFGLTVVEAMGCECLVIASDLEAIKEVVIDKETGILVKAGDERDLGDAIISTYAYPKKYSEIQKNGRKYATKNFDWSIIANKYSVVYRSVLEK